MPIYEYTCSACGHHFDRLVRSMSGGSEAATCPKCGSSNADRSLSLISVSAGGKSDAAPSEQAPMCGCGRRQGSCGMG